MMNRSRNFILPVVLLALLSALAYLQYRWQVQISQSEKEQAQKRLQSDAEHFAEDFNKVVQGAYFPFQISSGENWQNEFASLYRNWLANTEYPEIIEGFAYVSENNTRLSYDKETQQFVPANPGEEGFENIKTNFTSIDEKHLILRMPIYKRSQKLNKIKIIDHEQAPPAIDSGPQEFAMTRRLQMPEAAGYLLIELNQEIVKAELLKALNDKYFSDGSYRISVSSAIDNSPIFQTSILENADAEEKLFALSPDNFAIFVNRDLMTSLGNTKVRSNVIFSKKFETKNIETGEKSKKSTTQITVTNDKKPQFFQTSDSQPDAVWKLAVQHVSGSLENSAAAMLRKNLAISFGILFLLGASIGLIFISAQRSKMFAQRQIDFVSSVSHEFRTPLAVIYSAGENLADGVAKEQTQVSRYGDLIKNEGRKLSAMVEQILDFAGANSGKKKYDRRNCNVREIIENVIEECAPILQAFKVETEISENLPPVSADKNAIAQCLQNLIANSVKYSTGEKFLRLAAYNGAGNIKISVEDKGVGISSQDVKHIFEPFYRAKSVVDEQIHGSGLGLSLVKKTIEAHKGKISVESEVGKGSKFTIQLTTISKQSTVIEHQSIFI